MSFSDFLFGKKAGLAPQTTGATGEQATQSFGNTQTGLDQQQAFLQALQAQGGIQNQSDVYNQLALQASGQGPNPAQIALQNATGQNVANQAALMAGQRGAGANAGLIARQAAMQGAGIQQQAAGQGALMQAQQQLGALGQMGGIAGQQVQNQGQAGQAYGQLALGQQQNVYNSIDAQNKASIANKQQGDQRSGGFANILGSIGGALGGIGGLFGGGSTPSPAASAPVTLASAPVASAGIGKAGYGNTVQAAHGGAIPASGGPQSNLGKALNLQGGGSVPGQAKVSGDNLKNDTVPAMLSPGEIVIPRTVAAKGPDAAAEFVAAVQSRKSHSPSSKKKK